MGPEEELKRLRREELNIPPNHPVVVFPVSGGNAYMVQAAPPKLWERHRADSKPFHSLDELLLWLAAHLGESGTSMTEKK